MKNIKLILLTVLTAVMLASCNMNNGNITSSPSPAVTSDVTNNGNNVKDMASDASDTVGNAAKDVGDTAGNVARDAGDMVGDAANGVGDAAKDITDGAGDAVGANDANNNGR